MALRVVADKICMLKSRCCVSAKTVLVISLAAFILSVVGLSVAGKGLLQGMQQADATVSLLDLARQATTARSYEKADAYYQQAINFAETTQDRSSNVTLALGSYVDFLRMKRNPLKDVKLALKLEERALALRMQTF